MKVVTAFLPHSPAFDSCFPLLERLHQRGRVAVRAIVGPRLRQVEPRTIAACESARMPFVQSSLFRLEVSSLYDILRSGAVLTHSDPIAYSTGKFRLRDIYTIRSRTPVFFVQHGMVQSGLHLAGFKPRWTFYADRMLVWKPLPANASDFIEGPIADRMRVIGLIKTNRLGPSSLVKEMTDLFSSYRQRVLICHNYGFENLLYSRQAQERAFATWANVFRSRPDTLFIMRPHRGRKHAAFNAMTDQTRERCPNVLLSERHSGLMRMTTINDLLTVVDRVMTHPSTVVLDAIYEGKPVGVFDSTQTELDDLHQVESQEQIEAFLDDSRGLERTESLRKLYGNIDENLDRAAKEVEDYFD